MPNRVFFPQTAMDAWLIDGAVDLREDVLSVVADGEPLRRYRVLEAVRIVKEVTGGTDLHELVGRVKSKVQLEDKGAEILESSMLLGDNAYDVVPGWVGEPDGPFDAAAAKKAGTKQAPTKDEELLASYLLKAP
jgi:hypothetical protein